MAPTNTIKETLFQEIDRLPEPQLSEVLKYVMFLLYYQGLESITDSALISSAKPSQSSHIHESDPLASFIGAVDQAELAQDIDQTLYE
ncbi:MAG: hypothetical protein AAFV72_02860 [Cyanobacteria bacterium J06635_1]